MAGDCYDSSLQSQGIDGMGSYIGAVALVVRDYDEAITYYCEKLGFELIEDIPQVGKRWVVVAPPGANEARLLLAQASTEQQQDAVGNQTGGRVFLFLHTSDFQKDYDRMKSCGVTFLEEPRHEPYGTVVVFQDLYGNKWDLIEHKKEVD